VAIQLSDRYVYLSAATSTRGLRDWLLRLYNYTCMLYMYLIRTFDWYLYECLIFFLSPNFIAKLLESIWIKCKELCKLY
jgi:hypothetical protein